MSNVPQLLGNENKRIQWNVLDVIILFVNYGEPYPDLYAGLLT